VSPTVAVLYARKNSVYKTIPGTDVYDIVRDARTWPGGTPVVAHPPCRAWGRLRLFANPREDERELAVSAVSQVQTYGGVLEHPSGSTLWKHCGLPAPFAAPDEWGGWTLAVEQFHWGHRAAKATWLYIVGITRAELPPMPHREGEPTHIVSGSCRAGEGRRPLITKTEREKTPPAFAHWLLDLARRCRASPESLRQAAHEAAFC